MLGPSQVYLLVFELHFNKAHKCALKTFCDSIEFLCDKECFSCPINPWSISLHFYFNCILYDMKSRKEASCIIQYTSDFF